MKTLFSILIVVFGFQFCDAQDYVLLDYQNKEIGVVSTTTISLGLLDVGSLKEYYESGELKAVGNVKGGTYTQCCFSGPCAQPYIYKVGKWKYFYRNGALKAEGEFLTTKKTIQTSCKGGDEVLTGEVTNNWIFYTSNGDIIQSNTSAIKEIESEALIRDYQVKE